MAGNQSQEDSGSKKAPVFKTKDAHKREVSRLRTLKKERKMKMTDREGDIIPSPGKSTLSVESFCHTPNEQSDTDSYLNRLLDPEEPNPESKKAEVQEPGENAGQWILVALVAAVLTFIIAL